MFLIPCAVIAAGASCSSKPARPVPAKIAGLGAGSGLAPSTPVGAIPGELAVGSGGSATYSIPLELPPGTNGVLPSLELAYDHHQANGLLGVGWSVSGLSSIARCSKTIAQDGVRGGVAFDAGDRFCIDGRRLIAYKDRAGNLLPTRQARDAAYGADGTEYRAELDQGAHIVSAGACGKGPCSFTVRTRDGSELAFATTPDARILAQGRSDGAVRVWGLERATDRNGNYVELSYTQDGGRGGYHVDQIRYTGNARSGRSPQRLVTFAYEARPDLLQGYLGGSPAGEEHRLAAIRTYVDLDGDGSGLDAAGNLVSEYRLGYGRSSATGRSVITQIARCDARGTCLPATTFGLSTITTGLAVGTSLPLPDGFAAYFNAGTADRVPGDIDGDGHTDFAAFRRGLQALPLLVGNGDGSFRAVNASFPAGFADLFNVDSAQRVPGDYNGDGLFDMAVFKKGFQTLPVLLASGDGRTFRGVNQPLPAGFPDLFNVDNAQRIPGDYNGDGLTDFVAFKKGFQTLPVLLASGDGSFRGVNQPLPAGFADLFNVDNAQRISGDMNGDGLTDFVAFKKGFQTLPVLLANGDGTFRGVNQPLPAGFADLFNIDGVERQQADLNGDGLVDFIAFRKSWTTLPVLFSRGDGTFAGANQRLPDGFAALVNVDGVQHVSGDFNGDGLSDFAAFKLGYQTVPTLYSVGDGSVTGSNAALPQGYGALFNDGKVERAIGDFNGDGLFDVAAFKQGSQNVALLLTSALATTQGEPDLVTTITSGAGGVISLVYKPITDDSVYTSGPRPQYPIASVQRAIYVVASQTVRDRATNPRNTFVYDHTYESALFDLHRGWIGFARTARADRATQQRTTTTYRTDFPLVGWIARTDTAELPAPSRLLGVTASTYGFAEQNGVYNVWTEAAETQHYTEGKLSYTLRQTYEYDAAHQNVIVAGNLGDASDPDDDVYTCTSYVAGSGASWWKSYYPAAQKLTKVASACRAWDAWNAQTDLRWRTYGYDDAMNLTSERAWRDTDRTWIASQATYDAYGNATTHTNPRGFVTTIHYDPVYNTFPYQRVSPDPDPASAAVGPLTVTTVHEPRFGVNVRFVDPNGRVGHAIADGGIDGFGRVLQVQGTRPDSDAVVPLLQAQLAADPGGGLSHTTRYRVRWDGGDAPDASWPWTRELHDGLGRPYRTDSPGYDDASALVTEIDFDTAGRMKNQYAPYYAADGCVRYAPGEACSQARRATAYEYDIRGYPTRITTANGAVTQILYDSKDDRTVRRVAPDPRDAASGGGTVTWVSHTNTYGRVTWEQTPAGGTTTYTYDRLQRPATTTDPIGATNISTYDSMEQRIAETSPATGTTSYTYTLTGEVASRTDALGQRLVYDHDALDRVIAVRAYAPGSQTPERTTLYRYDDPAVPNGKGRLTSVTLPEASYTFAYDNTGAISEQAISIDTDGNGQPEVLRTRHAYDALGRITATTYPDGAVAQNGFDVAGMLRSVELRETPQGPSVNQATYDDYTAGGRAGKITSRNGVVSTYTFDVMGRLATRATRKSALTYYDFGYTRNKAGKLLEVADRTAQRLGQTFAYDNLGHLVQAGGPYPPLTYSYNATGDVTRQRDLAFKYDASKRHQLIGACNAAAGGDGCARAPSLQFEVKYDATGKTIQRGDSGNRAWHYVHDSAGALVKVDQEVNQVRQTVSTFAYDGSGNRLIKREADGKTTFYISPLYEVLSLPAGGGKPAVQIHTKYVLGQDEVVAAISGPPRSSGGAVDCRATGSGLVPGCNGAGYPEASQTRFFHHDALGSTDLATDETGAATSATRVAYEPFGEIAQNASSGRDDFRPKFTGKERDASSKLYYFGARYYDARLGRFLSPDPARQYQSPYVYGDSDPLSGVDPDGEVFVIDDAAVFAITVAVTAAVGAYAGGAIANESLNPLRWKWGSGKTWVGMFAGGAAGVAVAATGGAALAELGVVAAESVTLAGYSASSIAFGASNVAFLVQDTYQFATHPSLENAFFVALDLVPFVKGLGKGLRSAEQGARDGEAALHGGERRARGVGRETHDIELVDLESAAGEGCSSFTEMTEVATVGGPRAIRDIEVGDAVWAYDEDTGEDDLYPVSHLVSREASELVVIALGGDSIETTPEHPFYVAERGWVEAAQLAAGDRLVQRGGSAVAVTAVTRHGGAGLVYNFEVEGAHTYYVSDSNVLVHNVKAKCLVAKGKKRPSWKSGKHGVKEQLFTRQIVKSGKDKGLIQSGVSKQRYSRTHKIKIGKSGRQRTVWDIDHKIPYRFLLKAAEDAKEVVTWSDMREISNHLPNLRLLTMSENVGHSFEPTITFGTKEARKIFGTFGFTF